MHEPHFHTLPKLTLMRREHRNTTSRHFQVQPGKPGYSKSLRLEPGGCWLEVRGWRLVAGDWWLETGDWWLETGGLGLESKGSDLEAN